MGKSTEDQRSLKKRESGWNKAIWNEHHFITFKTLTVVYFAYSLTDFLQGLHHPIHPGTLFHSVQFFNPVSYHTESFVRLQFCQTTASQIPQHQDDKNSQSLILREIYTELITS